MADSEDSDDNVRALFAEPRPPIVGAQGHRFDACKHPKIDLLLKTGVAECRDCKQIVPLFQWLYDHTEHWRRAYVNYRHTKKATARLAAEEKDLKRRVKNLKAQAERWSEKVKRLKREAAEYDPEVAVLETRRGEG